MQAIMCLVPVCMFQIHVWFIVRAVVSQFTSVVMTGLFAPVCETVDLFVIISMLVNFRDLP